MHFYILTTLTQAVQYSQVLSQCDTQSTCMCIWQHFKINSSLNVDAYTNQSKFLRVFFVFFSRRKNVLYNPVTNHPSYK